MDVSALVYLFRCEGFAPAGDTVVAVAPLDVVLEVYGGGGIKGEAGLVATFGGAALFRNEETDASFLGVWGARNSARFRRDISEARGSIAVLNHTPPARLVWSTRAEKRPARKPAT